MPRYSRNIEGGMQREHKSVVTFAPNHSQFNQPRSRSILVALFCRNLPKVSANFSTAAEADL